MLKGKIYPSTGIIPEPIAGLEIGRGAATIDPRFSFSSFGFGSDFWGAVDCSDGSAGFAGEGVASRPEPVPGSVPDC